MFGPALASALVLGLGEALATPLPAEASPPPAGAPAAEGYLWLINAQIARLEQRLPVKRARQDKDVFMLEGYLKGLRRLRSDHLARLGTTPDVGHWRLENRILRLEHRILDRRTVEERQRAEFQKTASPERARRNWEGELAWLEKQLQELCDLRSLTGPQIEAKFEEQERLAKEKAEREKGPRWLEEELRLGSYRRPK